MAKHGPRWTAVPTLPSDTCLPVPSSPGPVAALGHETSRTGDEEDSARCFATGVAGCSSRAMVHEGSRISSGASEEAEGPGCWDDAVVADRRRRRSGFAGTSRLGTAAGSCCRRHGELARWEEFDRDGSQDSNGALQMSKSWDEVVSVEVVRCCTLGCPEDCISGRPRDLQIDHGRVRAGQTK